MNACVCMYTTVLHTGLKTQANFDGGGCVHFMKLKLVSRIATTRRRCRVL